MVNLKLKSVKFPAALTWQNSGKIEIYIEMLSLCNDIDDDDDSNNNNNNNKY